MFFLRVPPCIGHDPMTVGVSAGKQSGMSGRGARVGVVVVTIREISAVLEQKPKAAFTPLVAVTLEIVTSKLVDHYDDDELGASVVGRSETRTDDTEAQQKSHDRGAQRRSHCGVVYSL